MDVSSFLSLFLAPLITFLKQQGAWDTLVQLWQAASGLFGSIYGWTQARIDVTVLWQWVIVFFKFVFAVLITLFKVLTDIFIWLTQYFR
ncbi:MAG: hypothetical protein WC246_03155 [Candidatus Paceibacterota bacterium]|jgi:hypothetical protein